MADRDGNGLIEIDSLINLHNMRYNLEGTSYKTGTASPATSIADGRHRRRRLRDAARPRHLFGDLKLNDCPPAPGGNRNGGDEGNGSKKTV